MRNLPRAGWKANGVALVPGTAWTPGMRTAFRTAGRLNDEPRTGDVGHVLYPNLDGGRVGHVCFVETVSGDHVESIEGNTTGAGAGGASESSGVVVVGGTAAPSEVRCTDRTTASRR